MTRLRRLATPHSTQGIACAVENPPVPDISEHFFAGLIKAG
jgi:hypothetical protein